MIQLPAKSVLRVDPRSPFCAWMEQMQHSHITMNFRVPKYCLITHVGSLQANRLIFLYIYIHLSFTTGWTQLIEQGIKFWNTRFKQSRHYTSTHLYLCAFKYHLLPHGCYLVISFMIQYSSVSISPLVSKLRRDASVIQLFCLVLAQMSLADD